MAITWTPTVEDRWVAGGKRHARVKLVASGTYSAGGDAIPAAGALGMKRNVDFLVITDGSMATGHLYKYDQANKKIKIFDDNENATYLADQEFGELDAGTAVTTTVYCEVVGA